MQPLRVAIVLTLTAAFAFLVIPRSEDSPIAPDVVVQAAPVVEVVETPEPVVEPEPTPAPAVYYAPSGDWVDQCYAWAAEAGVPLDDAAIKLLERESHCNPTAHNPTSEAAGIPQALPHSKMGCELTYEDAVCQITWFYNYVVARYGDYETALQHSLDFSWY